MHVQAAAGMQLPFFMEEGAMDRDHIERIVEDLIICILLALIVQLIFPSSGISMGIPLVIPFVFVFPIGWKRRGRNGGKK
jgi:hypothetical protein